MSSPDLSLPGKSPELVLAATSKELGVNFLRTFFAGLADESAEEIVSRLVFAINPELVRDRKEPVVVVSDELSALLLQIKAILEQNLAVVTDGTLNGLVNAVNAVLFKLGELEVQIEREAEFLPKVSVFTSDVVYVDHQDEGNGKPDNEDDEMHPTTSLPMRIHKAFGREERDSFQARWIIVFGWQESGQDEKKLGMFEISAEYPALTWDQMYDYYDNQSSAGLKLVELAKALNGIEFKLTDLKGGQSIILDQEEAEQMIVAKVPREDLLEQLINSEGQLTEVVDGENITELSMVAFSMIETFGQEDDVFDTDAV